MSSSSLRQHQRKSVMVNSGHSPLGRNHSVGAPPHHHSSSTSFATQRSYRSLPSPRTATTTTTTPTTTPTDNVLYEDDNNQLNEKNSNNVFSFPTQISNFHHSSINHKIHESSIPRSTRHLCGTIMPLQSSNSSPNLNNRPTENDSLSPTSSTPVSLQKPEIKYRFFFFSFSFSFSISSFFENNLRKCNIIFFIL